MLKQLKKLISYLMILSKIKPDQPDQRDRVDRGDRVGLLIMKDTRVRGMRTLPFSLQKFNPKKYVILELDTLPDTLSNIRKKYNLSGFISFARNTWNTQELLNPIQAQKNNVILNDSNEFSTYNVLGLSISNGYFFARGNNMPWWWSFLTGIEFDSLEEEAKEAEGFNIGFYARAEHFNHSKYNTIFELLNKYVAVYGKINFFIVGTLEEYNFFINKFFKKYPPELQDDIHYDIHFKHYIDSKKMLFLLKDGEYWVTKLKLDSIPNMYYEAKYCGIKTRLIQGSNQDFLIGVDEIDLLVKRPNFKEEIKYLMENYSLILDINFKNLLFEQQQKHILKFPEVSSESFLVSFTETLDLIKLYNKDEEEEYERINR